jgi:hypothetical protein
LAALVATGAPIVATVADTSGARYRLRITLRRAGATGPGSVVLSLDRLG